MTVTNIDAIVVGAGVCGLTSALCLARRGLAVSVVARRLPPATDSCAAGAMWGPFLVDHPEAERWAGEGLTAFRELAAARTAGVTMVHGVEVARGVADPHPWLHLTGDLERCDEWAWPEYRSAWRYTTAVVDMPVYSEYLMAELRAEGVRVEQRELRSLRELSGRAPVIVNCSGSGARRLAGDPGLVPVRGLVVVVRNPGIDTFFAEDGEGPELTYYIPHGDTVVLGSTIEAPGGVALPEAVAAERIRRRCADIEPLLRDAPVIGVRSGRRPVRDRIRLETTTRDGQVVIHNYGHGGGGVTVSWGCGRDVASMVEACLTRLH
ncbi:amino acid oxidase [Actinoplanes lobatus]|uniref:D-amino-acid oxidase n=1 Tax=Actinoplanes lobatus TaxID=113568 RepID=A0A7W7H9W3_9ACTN|nr:FAD-dependent oxidoreductase [Actinoplanes lobatus]MBB4746591.1 D-amino-acid oxidase [Actinoplanes lobatus]GGN53142.1 amino acid oxidase [Actinoplanes lobatus]GIE38658.1 amino acid oxidase [Actinoplanes lobatus]